MKARLLGSLILGAIAAAIVVVYDATANHAALVRAAARSHQTVVSNLTAGFAGLTLIVAVIVFVSATVFAGRPRRQQAAMGRDSRVPAPRRRPRADVWR